MVRFAARDLTKLVTATAIDKPRTDDAGQRQDRVAALAQTMYCAPAEPAFSRVVLEGLVRAAEFALISIAGLAVYFACVMPLRGFEWPCLILIPAMAAGVVLLLQAFGLYCLSAFRKPSSQGFRLIAGIAAAYLIAFIASFIFKLDESAVRPFLLGWFAATLAAVLCTRILLGFITDRMSHAGRLTRRTVLVGGGETDTQEKIQHRVEHDLYYIENWSILLDLYILLATPFALLKTDNAY
ncbi:MAG: sugar transferase [Methylovirgula sp.]